MVTRSCPGSLEKYFGKSSSTVVVGNRDIMGLVLENHVYPLEKSDCRPQNKSGGRGTKFMVTLSCSGSLEKYFGKASSTVGVGNRDIMTLALENHMVPSEKNRFIDEKTRLEAAEQSLWSLRHAQALLNIILEKHLQLWVSGIVISCV